MVNRNIKVSSYQNVMSEYFIMGERETLNSETREKLYKRQAKFRENLECESCKPAKFRGRGSSLEKKLEGGGSYQAGKIEGRGELPTKIYASSLNYFAFSSQITLTYHKTSNHLTDP